MSSADLLNLRRIANRIGPAGGGGGVTTFNTRGGIVTLTDSDVLAALGYAPDRDTITATAAETLGGSRAVYLNDSGQALYADASADACRRTIGLTTGAAVLAAIATIQTEGVMINVGWAWSGNNPVWLAATGLLTQTVPTTGYLFQAGVPIGPTKIRIDPLLVAKL